MADQEQGQFSREVELEAETDRKELPSEEVASAEREEIAQQIAYEEGAQQAAFDEQEAANELATEQEIYGLMRQAEDISRGGAEYRHPSYFKYGILMSLAILADGLDLLTFTGFGILIAFFTSLFLNGTIFFIAWFTNTKYHRAKDFSRVASARLEEISGQLAALERNLAHTARVVKFFAGKRMTSAVLKQSMRGMSWLLKFVKNASLVIEVIPFLDFGFLPLTILSVGLSYWDERTMYKNAAQTGENVSSQISISAAEVV